jgi:hypothetical protein
VTYQGAFVMVLRIFDCDLCMIVTLDLLAHVVNGAAIRSCMSNLVRPRTTEIIVV